MTIYTKSRTLAGTCGVGLFHDFSDYSWDYENYPLARAGAHGGCGWQIAGFINGDPNVKEAYHILKERYKIVMQSPIRRNSNSGHNFFFVLYDTKKQRKSKNNPTPEKYSLAGNKNYEWPWK